MKILDAGGYTYTFREEAEKAIREYEIPDYWIVSALTEYTQSEIHHGYVYRKAVIYEGEVCLPHNRSLSPGNSLYPLDYNQALADTNQRNNAHAFPNMEC